MKKVKWIILLGILLILVVPYVANVSPEYPCGGEIWHKEVWIESLIYRYNSFSDCSGLDNFHIVFLPESKTFRMLFEWVGDKEHRYTFIIYDLRTFDWESFSVPVKLINWEW